MTRRDRGVVDVHIIAGGIRGHTDDDADITARADVWRRRRIIVLDKDDDEEEAVQISAHRRVRRSVGIGVESSCSSRRI